MKKNKKGFTLIELMIVVAIIGVLAAIAIPRFAQMLEKARDGSTKGNLGSIRSAIAIYYGDNEGVWPVNISINFGSYLSAMPPAKSSPLGQSSAVALVTDAWAVTGTGWAYCSFSSTLNSMLGGAWPYTTATDSKGTAFNLY